MSLPKPYEEHVKRFFDFLFRGLEPGSYIETRQFNSTSVNRKFYTGVDNLVNHLFNEAGRFENTFFGVMPRRHTGGTKADVVPSGDILWADLDMKDGSTLNDLLLSPLPKPCVIVASGHGFHAYWRLNRYVPTEEIEQMNRNVAAALGSDNVHDSSRVMRIPYTINSKPGQPEVTTTIIVCVDKCEGHYPESFSVAGAGTRARGIKARKMELPEGHKSRSEKLFLVAVKYALHGGRDLAELEDLMRAIPEGEKLDEMAPGRREQWIDLTLKNARKSILRRPKT